MKKFVDGLLFGAGFAISFVAILLVSNNWISTAMIECQIEESVSNMDAERCQEEITEKFKDQLKESKNEGKLFHKLPLEEKIERASVIALVRYEDRSGPKVRAVIDEFLKKTPSSKIHYDVGDEYTYGNYYPKDGLERGDGLVVFFTDSPATMTYSTTYDNSRILGLSNIPINLLKNKIKNYIDYKKRSN